jgi:hypothetical protein
MTSYLEQNQFFKVHTQNGPTPVALIKTMGRAVEGKGVKTKLVADEETQQMKSKVVATCS